MGSKIVQARNVRNNFVVLASTSAELVALLDLYAGTSASDPEYLKRVTVQLLPIDYEFTAAQLPLQIRSYLSLVGTGAQKTRLISMQTTSVGAKNVISCLDQWSSGGGSNGPVRNVTLAGFSIVGDAYAPAGIYAKGLQNSKLRDIQIRSMTAAGSIGVQLDAELAYGTYYNDLQSIEVGWPGVGSGCDIGFRLKTTDWPAEPRRMNSNSLLMCSAKWCVDAGYEINGAVGITMTACEAEQNATGLRVLNSVNTVLTGGYFENHSNADIQLGTLSGAAESSERTLILQTFLQSTTMLAGQSLGSSGDVYLASHNTDDPTPTDYDNNWMDKAYIRSFAAGYAEFAAHATSTRVGYYKMSGDANYRLEVFNDGRLKFGGGAGATDVELYRRASNILTLANNDSFQINGTGSLYLSASSVTTPDSGLERQAATTCGTLSALDTCDIRVQGGYNTGRFRLGTNYLWVDASNRLRFHTAEPSADGDGSSMMPVTLNALAAAADYTIAVGTTGTDVNVAAAGSTVTVHVPDASATNRGAVTTGSQTFAGEKTFGSMNITALSDIVMVDCTPFATQTNHQQIWRTTAGVASTWIDAAGRFVAGAGSFTVSNTFHATLWSGGAIGWASGAVSGTSAHDTAMFRDGAVGTIGLRVTTQAHSLRVYNTWTSSTNYERSVIDWITTANTCRIGTEKGSGGGTARDLALITDATVRLLISASGAVTLTLGSDATGDIWYRNSGGNMVRLPIGSTSDVLTVTGGVPVWAAPGMTQAKVLTRGLGC